MLNAVELVLAQNPPPSKRLCYGTAGFRDRNDLPLDQVFRRVGVLAYLRSRGTFPGLKCVGVMITASHNPEIDNGVKIVDPDGGMLAQSWEVYAESLANAKNLDDLNSELLDIVKVSTHSAGVVVIGRDTRSHSLRLANEVIQGVRALGGIILDLGEVTTPQLHYVVQNLNLSFDDASKISESDALKVLQNYYYTIISGYTKMCQSTPNEMAVLNRIVLDGSFGVGALAINASGNVFESLSSNLVIDLRNNVRDGPVNEKCGAEHVQKNQMPPCGVSIEQDANSLMCSFDGDADRIVFHAFINNDQTSKWVLFDGDKIAAIISLFLGQELREVGLESELSLGVVQTAYANGASTKFLKQNNIHVVIAKTGVKYLHHKALDFDIGVYFEANGHGTVLLSDKFVKLINSLAENSAAYSDRKQLAISRLRAFMLAINQAVGDAFSDMLVVLACLKIFNMGILTWNGLYTDLPSKQIKVPLKNKHLIICSEDETKVLSPTILQLELDKCMADVPSGRCFIRPSGTEDVVRVYSEAETQAAADALADKAIQLVNSIVV